MSLPILRVSISNIFLYLIHVEVLSSWPNFLQSVVYVI
jgi:hypothetical protein